MRVLLVGLGRMGQRYAKVLKQITGPELTLFTVDPQTPGENAGQHAKTINDLDSGLKFDLAIDAHPNQGRLELLQEFCRRQVPHVIIEKPHATSLRESQRMLDLMKNHPSTRVMLPFFRNYAPVFAEETLSQLGAGKLLSIHTTAGAIGLGCNGVHFLNLATRLFKQEPQSVYAELQKDSIPSPRGAQYTDHAGTVVVRYPSGQYILNIHPDSSMGINTILQFESGKIQICEQSPSQWSWWRRTPENMNLPVYRTNMEAPVEPPMQYKIDLEDLMAKGISAFLRNDFYPTLKDGHDTLKTIALSVLADTEKRQVKWNEDSKAAEISFSFT